MLRRKTKKSKILYYLHGLSLYLAPRILLRRRLASLLHQWQTRQDAAHIAERVDYYCKLNAPTPLPPDAELLAQHHWGHPSVYFIDSFEYTRYFPQHLRWHLRRGDDKTIATRPSIQKARTLQGDNTNATLLKMDKVRHFFFVNDRIPFSEKEDRVVFRGATRGKPLREAFLRRYHDCPLCDVGDTCGNQGVPRAPRLGMYEHLRYKFIMCLEGNDVASNLKWVMSSNSVAVMPPPTCETWFMEGRLVPNVHYIAIRPDYSDLEERIAYYIAHPEEAEQIAHNANKWVKQFQNPRRERIISLLTLAKYLERVNA